ncbi:hypothetical protein J6590_055535 [Homalodisca vitripennis]|nr:hypothetical protein J6590_055535 [Homalodisca vitripennis]
MSRSARLAGGRHRRDLGGNGKGTESCQTAQLREDRPVEQPRRHVRTVATCRLACL